MPHDPKNVKLRPGAANPKYVKLYPWTSAGALTITEIDSEAGTEAVYVDRVFDIIDAGAGSEVVQALIPTTVLVTDSGAGIDDVYADTVGFFKRPVAIPRIQVLSDRVELKKILAKLRVYYALIREEDLSPGNNPARLIELRLPTMSGENTVKHVRSGWINDDHDIALKTKGSGAIPSGYRQGGKSVKAAAYIKGRTGVLDAFLSDTGDSEEIDILEFHCKDPQGLHVSVYLINARILAANPVFKDRDATIYEYQIKADKWTFTPPIGILKMVHKPVSAPLTITIIHPVIEPITTILAIIEGADYFNDASLTTELEFILEQSLEDEWPLTSTLEISESAEEPDALEITTSSEAVVT